jgi:hypothetical protein
MDGKLGAISRDDQRASDPGHGPVLLPGKIKTDDGDYPIGLILTRGGGNLQPLQVVEDDALGTGNGSTKTYTGTLGDGLPVEPGTVVITDGVETFSDDGSGRLVGDAAGTGTVNYETAGFSVTFNANVGDGTGVTGDCITRISGVLDEAVDTTKTGSALYIHHGTCRQDMLKVGKTAQDAPDVVLLALMQERGIYPV